MDSGGMRHERCRFKEILEFEAMKKQHLVLGATSGDQVGSI